MTITNLLIYVLAFGCLLNLNGVGLMVVGINQLYSPFLLMSSGALIIIALKQRAKISNELLTYLLSIFIYLIIGSIVGMFFAGDSFNLSLMVALLVKYLTSVLIITAAYMSVVASNIAPISILRMVLALCCVASIFIPFGEYINVSGKIIVGTDRGAGLFGNPNEAGIITAVGFILSLSIVQRPAVKIALLLFFFSMALLTFSKTVLLMIIAIFFFDYLIKGNVSKGFLKLLAALVCVIVVLLTFRQEIVDSFDGNQARRVNQTIDLILFTSEEKGGGVEESRGFLWKIGLEKISRHPIAGNGLGALHSMQGANVSVNNKVLQGVHNTYLVRIGDAGILGLASFLFFLLVTGYRSATLASRSVYAKFTVMYLGVFALSCMATHGAETLRFHNYLIGISLGMLRVAKLHTAGNIQQSNIPGA